MYYNNNFYFKCVRTTNSFLIIFTGTEMSTIPRSLRRGRLSNATHFFLSSVMYEQNYTTLHKNSLLKHCETVLLLISVVYDIIAALNFLRGLIGKALKKIVISRTMFPWTTISLIIRHCSLISKHLLILLTCFISFRYYVMTIPKCLA